MLDIHVQVYFWLCPSGTCGVAEAQPAAEPQPGSSRGSWLGCCVLFPALALAVAPGRKERSGTAMLGGQPAAVRHSMPVTEAFGRRNQPPKPFPFCQVLMSCV